MEFTYIYSTMRPITTLLLLGTITLSVQAQQWVPVSGTVGGMNLCQTISADTCQAAASGGRLYATRDGGASFDSVQTIFTTEEFTDMHFPSANVGYACGGSSFGVYKNIIAKTVDGGATWFALTHDEFGWYYFNSIRFLNDDIGFVSGDLDTFLKTEDGGDTFTQVDLQLPGINQVTDIYFDGDIGYISTRVNDNDNAIYRILKTEDLGSSWTILYADTVLDATSFTTIRTIHSVRFLGSLGLACGDNGLLLRTADGGTTWTEDLAPTDSTFFTNVELVNEQTAFITAGWAGPGVQHNTRRTDDGGLTWTILPEEFQAISVVDGVGYAIDDSYQLFKNAEVANGVREDALETLSLFPNPSTGTVNVQLPKTLAAGHLAVNDGNGRTVLEHQVTGQQLLTFNAAGLATGVYVVKVKEDGTGETYRQRFVVE